MPKKKNEIEELTESLMKFFVTLEFIKRELQKGLQSMQTSQSKSVVRTPRVQVELRRIDDDIRELEEELRRCKDDKCRKKVLEEIRKLQRKKQLILRGG